jgi:hypothetical protein
MDMLTTAVRQATWLPRTTCVVYGHYQSLTVKSATSSSSNTASSATRSIDRFYLQRRLPQLALHLQELPPYFVNIQFT